MAPTRMLGLVAAVFFFAANVSANEQAPGADATPEQNRRIQEYHESIRLIPHRKPTVAVERPFSELEEAGYLFFSAETVFNSLTAKRIMARELPADTTLVIYTDRNNKESIRRAFAGYIEPNRLKIVTINAGGNGFWSRDGLPVPIWGPDSSLNVVDARYYHNFEPDQVIANWFEAHLLRHNYYFEGGNFMVNDVGDCITVDNQRSIRIPNEIFYDHYGCKRLIRLPHEKGIGHIDESVRFVARNKVLTDLPSYADRLRAEGFEVTMLPRPRYPYESYVNSLLVNGTIFVPVFEQPTDREAVDVYQRAGLKVVPIETITLSNQGRGSIHCITMTYPNVPFSGLITALGLKEL